MLLYLNHNLNHYLQYPIQLQVLLSLIQDFFLLNLKYHFVSSVSGWIKQNDKKQPTKQNKKKVFRKKLFQKVKTKTKKLKK